MRRIKQILCVAVALFTVTFANSQESAMLESALNVGKVERVSAGVKPTAVAKAISTDAAVADVQQLPIAKSVGGAINASNPIAPVSVVSKSSTRSVPVSAASLKGSYVIAWETLASTSFNGGANATIVPDAEGDSITIQNFWSGAVVRGRFDAATGKMTIPMQIVGSYGDFGQIYIAVCGSTGAPEKTSEIEATIDANGKLTFTTWWGVYVLAGTNKDKFIAAYYNTWMARTNATMSYLRNGTPESYGVIATQTSANVLHVDNFANAGIAVDIDLKRDRTAEIASQVAMVNASGSWQTIKCVAFNDAGNLTSYSSKIVTDKAADDNNTTITWTDWSLLTTGYYAGRITETVLKMDNPITYPSLKVSSFEGEGTEANPYKISTLDHLILLADLVNTDTLYVSQYYNSTYTRSFIGKYFEMTNDIDMSGYRYESIGSTFRQRFAGVFDGKGHTISGLTIKAGADFNAGLFGYCDTVSVLKNIVFDSPEVTASYYSATTLVASTMGDVLNITVNNPTITEDGGHIICAGVAGVVGGKIENCHVVGGTISGYGYVAGVVAEAHGGVYNCSATGTKVTSAGKDYPVGGVVANILKNPGKNLCFAGTVSYANYAEAVFGGVAGLVQQTSLENSFAAGLVAGYSSETILGGVVGRAWRAKISNCYSAGRVQCYSRATGGVVGRIEYRTVDSIQTEITNCYTSASVIAETYMYDKNECREVIGKIDEGASPVLTNLYYDSNVTNFYSKRFGSTTAELTSAAGPKGFDSSVWEFTPGVYPRLKESASTPNAQYSAASVELRNGLTFKKMSTNTKLNSVGNTLFLFANGSKLTTKGHYASIVGDSLIIGDNFGTDTLFVVNSNNTAQAYHFIGVAPIPFEGEGTIESPFLIKSKEDLIALSVATTDKGQLFPETYFKMTNDIDLEYDERFVGINANAANANNSFAGVFDGAGYTIHKMKLIRGFWTKEPTATVSGTVNTDISTSYGGFIGRLGTEGVLKNLTIAADCELLFYGTSGALVGYNYGTIENCKNYADVLGLSCWIGGITGQALKESVIRNCYNAGNVVTYYANVGGIAGTAYGTIENCVNTGNIATENRTSNYVKQMSRAGGIAGNSAGGIFRNCINYGTIYAARDYVGGISGTLEGTGTSGIGKDEVYSCVNVGMVYIGAINAGTAPDPSKVGAIGGSAGTKAAANVYWDAQLIDLKANGNQDVVGMTGLPTAKLTGATPLEGLSDSIWDFKAGKYPTIKLFANEEKVAAARSVILSLAEGETTGDINTNATLSEGTVWTLAKANQFTIEGQTLKVPATVEAVISDTLYALNAAGVVKPILIKSLPSNPLSGKGTEADPYLINTADEWNALATFMTATANSLKGEFVKITADIDFTGKKVNNLANDGVTALEGTLDGDNHTIKGVALKMISNQRGALIGTIEKSGKVMNLTVDGTQTGVVKVTYTAGVVDKLYGTLENVTSTMKITSQSASYSSGVVGYAYEGAVLNKVVFKGTLNTAGTYGAGVVSYAQQGVTLTDCGNEGSIEYTGTSASSYTAGVVANALPGTYIRCYNKGEVGVKNITTAGAVGGVIANAPGLKASPNYVITGCWNEGDIVAASKIAGIVASIPTSSSNAANAVYTITDCYNTGDISAMSEKVVSSAPTAGIIIQYTPSSSIINCYNTGNILSSKNVYCAGIVGNYLGTPAAATPVVIKGCYNTGNIVADGNQGAGVVAYATGAITVEDCYNTGEIEGNQMIGGVVGCLAGSGPKVINCYNTGNVTGKAYRVGGIISYGSPTNGVVEGCWNVGNVASTATTNGTKAVDANAIGGLAGASGASFVNCYNAGSVTGLSQVGGLVGVPTKARTSFTNCYNAGKIVAPADTCGSIVGVNTGNGKIWIADNKVVDTYYIDSNKCENAVEAVGTSVSVAQLAALNLGEAYYSVDDYTYPVLATAKDNDAAVFNAAQVVVAEGDSYDKVTKSFHVGAPSVVNWSSNCSELVFDGNTASFSKSFSGNIAVKAACGELTKTYDLVASNATSGIDDVDADKEIDNVIYYNAAGVRVNEPMAHDGGVYVKVVTYVDGTKQIIKIINK